MFKFIITKEQAHELIGRAAEPQAVGWVDAHGEISRVASRGEEISVEFENGRFDLKAGCMYCMLYAEPVIQWLTYRCGIEVQATKLHVLPF
jgi:hypothetical protein